MSDTPKLTTPDTEFECDELTPTSLSESIFGRYGSFKEIAIEGARLIVEYFPGSCESILHWSPLGVPGDTALVRGALVDSDEHDELFKKLLRHYFRVAGIRELSYVEYFDGGADPIWVMLIDVSRVVNPSDGVDLCRWASFGWSLQKYLKLNRQRKRWLGPTLKLLLPDYPDVDRRRPLNELMLSGLPAL